jgi:hypothetical protein
MEQQHIDINLLDNHIFYTPLTEEIIGKYFFKPNKLELQTIYALKIITKIQNETTTNYQYGIILRIDDFFKLYTLDIEKYIKYKNTIKLFKIFQNVNNNVFKEIGILNNGFVSLSIGNPNKVDGVYGVEYTAYQRSVDAGVNEFFSNDGHGVYNSSIIGSNRPFSRKTKKLFGPTKSISVSRVLGDPYLSHHLKNFNGSRGGKTKQRGKYKKNKTKNKKRY